VRRIKVGFVLHVMNVAGAEVLVAETVRRLRARIAPVIFCIDEVGALGQRMREEGVDVIAFDRRPGLDLRVAWRMAAEIRARALDVVHAHQYTPFFYGSIAARLSHVRPRVIFTEHGRHFPDVVSPKRWIINRVVFDRLADNVNAVCEFSARALRDNLTRRLRLPHAHVVCADGRFKVTRVQPADGKKIEAGEWAKGANIPPKARFT